MEARARVREFLQGRPADRPPFLPLALDFSAALAQTTRRDMLGDPGVLTAALLDVIGLFSLDGVIVALEADELDGLVSGAPPDRISTVVVCAEAFDRLRVLLGDRAAIGVLLPGPASVLGRRAGELEGRRLEDAATKLLSAAQALGPPQLDVIGVWEALPVTADDAEALRPALAPLWNAVRFYSRPSLFASAGAEPAAGSIGASAVSAWSGATPEALVAAGARRVGVPVEPSGSPPVPALPPNGFFVTPGELPSDSEIGRVRALCAGIGLVRNGASA